MTKYRGRSAAAREASRTNGARSLGPRSQAGKQTSARNSLKHGLFSSGASMTDMSPAAAAWAAELNGFAADGWQSEALIQTVVTAVSQLEQANVLVRRAREQIAELLSGDVLDRNLLEQRVEELLRLGRYERRFRGRRDRALRKLMVSWAGA